MPKRVFQRLSFVVYVLHYYPTTLYLSKRIRFLYMNYGTTQLHSTYPRELVSCIANNPLLFQSLFEIEVCPLKILNCC